jgi:anti-sigma B factor antagonist
MIFYLKDEAVSDDTHIMALGGEVDLSANPAFKETLDRLLDQGKSRLLIDLSETTFIDSTAIGALMVGLKRLRESGGSLELICANRNVLRVFEIVGLDQEVPIHSTREEALHALAGTA